MILPIEDFLNAGLLAHGKFPDLFWEFDLSGNELKVLRYAWDNCIRLFATLKKAPRNDDGVVVFYRSKELMAEDCRISTTGFRNAVRSLHKKGLVTSMESGLDKGCIGVTTDFLDGFISNANTENNLRLSSLKDLIVLLYNEYLLELIVNKENKDKDNTTPLSTNVLKLCESQGFVDSDISQEEDETQTTENSEIEVEVQSVEKTKIDRKPIYVGRTPLLNLPRTPIVNGKLFSLQKYQNKLKELDYVLTSEDKELLKIAEYYEFKVRKAINTTGFKCLSKDFRNHRNWKYLERLHQLCSENGWDYKIYLDSQFERVKNWQHGQKYPYLNQIFSENAIKCYHSYLKDYAEKYSVTEDAKPKAEKVKSVTDEVAENIVKDCETISEWLKSAKKRRNLKHLTDAELKMVFLDRHWGILSAHYLAHLSWFPQFLLNFQDTPWAVELREKLMAISESKKLSSLCCEIVRETEKMYNIPETMSVSQPS